MASIKSLFDAQCGTQAPLLSLSKNYAHTNSRVPSTSINKTATNLPNGFGSSADAITNDYLQNVSARTDAPNTFDMSSLLQQCSTNSVFSAKPPLGLTLMENWAKEYSILHQHSQNGGAHSKQISDRQTTSKPHLEVLSSRGGIAQQQFVGQAGMLVLSDGRPNFSEMVSPMRPLMNAFPASITTTATQSMSGQENSIAIWASDFLDDFEKQAEEKTEVSPTVSSCRPSAGVDQSKVWDAWVEDFLRKQADVNLDLDDGEVVDDYRELNDDAFRIFSNYEDEWRKAEQRLTNVDVDYQFREDNHYLNHPDPITKAKELFGNGNVMDAVLCYESALQRNPNDAETWCSLGLCHAENERDVDAIAAFRRSLDLEPNNRRTLLAAAVSLANENMESLAFRNLDQWITGFLASGDATGWGMEAASTSSAFLDDRQPIGEEWVKELERKFQRAVDRTAATDLSGDEDAARRVSDLHNALSIFYNLSKDYDKAIDAIRAAIALNPEDPILWNRLGASLANSDRSAEAIGAYRKALEMFPAYVRARYNLGVSCMNLYAYGDAIGHFLSALRLQKSPHASPIWTKLRSCIIRTLDTWDSVIVSGADGGDDDNADNSYTNVMLRALEDRDIERLTQIYNSARRV